MHVTKLYLINFLVIVFSLVSCENAGEKNEAVNADTIPPEIKLFGNKIDTAYLNTFYTDAGAYCFNEEPFVEVEKTGKLNTEKSGTYYLDYDAKDVAGNMAATITRTVHVVESKAAFLSGEYNVACTCTASIAGSPNTTVTADNYTAAVRLSQTNNQFEIIQLKLGADYVIPVASLYHNSIIMNFYRNFNCTSSSTVTPSKNTFTIETIADGDYPNKKYACKNVYTKQLHINYK